MHIYTTNDGYCINGNDDMSRNLMSKSPSHVANTEFYGDFVFTFPHVEADNTKLASITELFENYNE